MKRGIFSPGWKLTFSYTRVTVVALLLSALVAFPSSELPC